MMTALHRRRRRISQTIEQMSCTYICSMMPRGLISRSKASRKASNSSADSVISNGDFGRSVSSFVRRISHSNELTRGQGADRSGHTRSSSSTAFMAGFRTAGEIMLALQIKAYVVAPQLMWRKWTRSAADSAVRLPRRDRNGGLLTFGEFAPLQHSDTSVKRPTGRAERTPFVFKVTTGRVRTGTEA